MTSVKAGAEMRWTWSCSVERLDSVSKSLARLDELLGIPAPPAPSRAVPPVPEPLPETEVTHIGPVQSQSLLEYLKQRGIDRKRVAPFVKEIRYRRGERSYFSLGFASDSGGIELRSPSFKGTLGTKDMTVIQGDPHRVLVFEGFFDFLTAVTLCRGCPDATVIVLNSVALKEKAAELGARTGAACRRTLPRTGMLPASACCSSSGRRCRKRKSSTSRRSMPDTKTSTPGMRRHMHSPFPETPARRMLGADSSDLPGENRLTCVRNNANIVREAGCRVHV